MRRVFAALDRDGEEARIVGGAVRNALIGEPVQDIDFATTALPEEIVRRATDAGLKCVPTGIEHGTVTIVHASAPYEVTTLREDVETDGRRAKVRFGRDFEHDARRRDFTMNAIAVDLRDGSEAVVLLEAEGVTVDGVVEVRGKLRIEEGQTVEVDPDRLPVAELPQPDQSVRFTVVHEDDQLIIVDKPAGLVVHPGAGNEHGTLVNGLLARYPELRGVGEDHRPGIVHRIDKDTSGLLVIAKTEEAMTGLAAQFFHHTIGRTYQALVWGEPDPAEGTIDVNLGRSPKDRRVTIAFPSGEIGRRAVTHYRVLKPMRYVSLIECRLETGRTHQIRVHMAHIGHPLVGDPLYAGRFRSSVIRPQPSNPFS